MVSQPNQIDDSSKEQEGIAANKRQNELVAELIGLQRERHDLQRERHEIARRIVENDREQAQRHYDYLSKQLEVQEEQNKRGYRLVSLIVGGFALVLFLLLYMVFYGSEAQAGKAEKLLIGIILLLGGFSLRDLIGRVQKRLINS